MEWTSINLKKTAKTFYDFKYRQMHKLEKSIRLYPPTLIKYSFVKHSENRRVIKQNFLGTKMYSSKICNTDNINIYDYNCSWIPRNDVSERRLEARFKHICIMKSFFARESSQRYRTPTTNSCKRTTKETRRASRRPQPPSSLSATFTFHTAQFFLHTLSSFFYDLDYTFSIVQFFWTLFAAVEE